MLVVPLLLLCCQGLQLLNAAGYGVPGSGLHLDLVYNPAGSSLAPDQAKLEQAYKSELQQVNMCMCCRCKAAYVFCCFSLFQVSHCLLHTCVYVQQTGGVAAGYGAEDWHLCL